LKGTFSLSSNEKMSKVGSSLFDSGYLLRQNLSTFRLKDFLNFKQAKTQKARDLHGKEEYHFIKKSKLGLFKNKDTKKKGKLKCMRARNS
jgi:hypothetical protein